MILKIIVIYGSISNNTRTRDDTIIYIVKLLHLSEKLDGRAYNLPTTSHQRISGLMSGLSNKKLMQDVLSQTKPL